MVATKKQHKAGKLPKVLLAFAVTLMPLIMIAASSVFALYDSRPIYNLQNVANNTEVQIFSEPLLSITFDDGHESVYSQAAKVLDKYGVPTTQYILSGTFDDHKYLSRAQAKSLHDAGHDIQSHTVSHPNLLSLSPRDVDKELKQSRDDISRVLGHSVTEFASPLNSYNSTVLKQVEALYRSHRNTAADIKGDDEEIDFNTATNFNPYEINGYSIRRSTTVQEIQSYIQAAKQRKAWIILIYHEVEPKSENYYGVEPADFENQINAIKTSEIKLVTIKQAVDAYYKGKP